MDKHIFWWSLTIITLTWYALICIYVGVKGGIDIRRMIERLKEQKQAADE